MTDATPAGWRRPSHVQQPLTAVQLALWLIAEARWEADQAAQELAAELHDLCWLNAADLMRRDEARAERDEARQRWTDLRQRLERANQQLIQDERDYGPTHSQAIRLRGKVSGVQLALSYMNDTERLSSC
jgi:hypothetical protein